MFHHTHKKRNATKHYTTLGYHFSHIPLVKNIHKFDHILCWKVLGKQTLVNCW